MPKDYQYLGVYTAVRVAGLNVEEWKSLSDEVKTSYVNTTKEKNKDPRSIDAIRVAYDRGELSVPCARLQCTGFDESLYHALVAAHSTLSSSRPPRNKRRREDEEDNPPRSKAGPCELLR
ncbi:hypothetical protein H0H87_003796 [Tephrocybe sp. NHM501043]|nr:hypothetical protein H0H87_003796 [Tephrocybe sp. NHM501043]